MCGDYIAFRTSEVRMGVRGRGDVGRPYGSAGQLDMGNVDASEMHKAEIRTKPTVL